RRRNDDDEEPNRTRPIHPTMVRAISSQSYAQAFTSNVGVVRPTTVVVDDDDDEDDIPMRFESGVAIRFSSSERQRRARAAAAGVLWPESGRVRARTDYRSTSLVADVAAAGVALAFVSVPVGAIDRAVVQSVAGSVPLARGLWQGIASFAREPVVAFRHRA